MRKIRTIVLSFLKRGGAFFFGAFVIERLAQMILSLLLIQILSKQELGIWYAFFVVIQTLLPLRSWGLEISYVYYGRKEKPQLWKAYFKKGIAYSIISAALGVAYSLVVLKEYEQSTLITLALSTILPIRFLFTLLQNHYRVLKLHKSLSILVSTHSVLLILSGLGTYFWGIWSPVIGLPLSGLLASLVGYLLMPKEPFSVSEAPSKEEWKAIRQYGSIGSLTNFFASFIFLLDIFLLEFLTKDPIILAEYRASLFLPMNLPLLAAIFISSDFVHLRERKHEAAYLKRYLKQYFQLFVPLSIVLLSAVFLLRDYWIPLLLGKKYLSIDPALLLVFLLCAAAIILLRVPHGNLLAAVGKLKVNFYVALFSLVFNISVSYILFQYYGVNGIGFGSLLTFFVSGSILFIACQKAIRLTS